MSVQIWKRLYRTLSILQETDADAEILKINGAFIDTACLLQESMDAAASAEQKAARSLYEKAEKCFAMGYESFFALLTGGGRVNG